MSKRFIIWFCRCSSSREEQIRELRTKHLVPLISFVTVRHTQKLNQAPVIRITSFFICDVDQLFVVWQHTIFLEKMGDVCLGDVAQSVQKIDYCNGEEQGDVRQYLSDHKEGIIQAVG